MAGAIRTRSGTLPSDRTFRRGLIVAPAWVGDMVMAHTLVQMLSVRNPGIELHVLAPAATAPVAERMAEISRVEVFEPGHGELHIRTRRAVGRALRAYDYDAAWVLPNTLKSALVPWFAAIPRRVGWWGEGRLLLLNDMRRLHETRYPLMVQRYAALALPPGSALPERLPEPRLIADAQSRERQLCALGLKTERPVTVLCPGAEFGPAKQWPATHYAEVAVALLGRGEEVWLMGSPKDVPVCDTIRQLAPGVRNIAGSTGLAEAIDVLSAADRVVCNDSGLMHVACALGKQVIALFGSTSPAFTPPLSARATVLRTGIECSPCFERTCPLGHLRCLRELEPARVLNQL